MSVQCRLSETIKVYLPVFLRLLFFAYSFPSCSSAAPQAYFFAYVYSFLFSIVINGLSSELVPGDILIIEDGMSVPCDVCLLSGQCVMNESMLTGGF